MHKKPKSEIIFSEKGWKNIEKWTLESSGNKSIVWTSAIIGQCWCNLARWWWLQTPVLLCVTANRRDFLWAYCTSRTSPYNRRRFCLLKPYSATLHKTRRLRNERFTDLDSENRWNLDVNQSRHLFHIN